MNLVSSLERTEILPFLIDRVKNKQEEIHAWLDSYEQSNLLPLYSSVDIRDAGFKIAVVDTNLFPAGFNNLCEHGLADSVSFMRTAIKRRVPECKDILIIAEEHTRNTWYLENVRILQEIIRQSGFKTTIATFLTVQPDFCQKMNFVELETAQGHPVQIHCLKKLLENFEEGNQNVDLIIMNNDLISGIPPILKNSRIPIYPSIQAGWHSRLKSFHFQYTKDLIDKFASIVDLDPWLFSCLYSVESQADINNGVDRVRLQDATSDLFQRINQKYKEHHINEKPYVVLKADSGTYGMGVMTIEDPAEITQLNRKKRNQLYKGKSAQVIERYLLQEGVPTIYNIDKGVSEVCIYQVENNLVGGFYRSHAYKGQRENLNSRGMEFKKMCPHLKKFGDCGVHHDINIFDIYRIIARIAGVAARKEIVQLEANIK